MELVVLESKKNKLKLEIKGESHALCNALRHELWNDKAVTKAGYRLESSLEAAPLILVESTNPKKSLAAAASRLRKTLSQFEDKFKKAIK